MCIGDDKGQALAYVYNVDEPGRRTAMKRLMRHEALEVAAGDGTYGTIVKLLILTGERRSEITRWRCLWRILVRSLLQLTGSTANDFIVDQLSVGVRRSPCR